MFPKVIKKLKLSCPLTVVTIYCLPLNVVTLFMASDRKIRDDNEYNERPKNVV